MRDSGVKLVTTLDALPANIPENDFDRSNRNIYVPYRDRQLTNRLWHLRSLMQLISGPHQFR